MLAVCELRCCIWARWDGPRACLPLAGSRRLSRKPHQLPPERPCAFGALAAARPTAPLILPPPPLPLPLCSANSQPSSIDTRAELPAGIAASPVAPPPLGGGATSSLHSAGTVSGEVAQQAASAVPSLKRALSSSGEEDGADSLWTKSARLEGGAEPGRHAAAARAHAAWADPAVDPAAAADSGDEATHTLCSDSSDGLEFLLRACEMLDPLAHAAAEAEADAVTQRCAETCCGCGAWDGWPA